MVAGNPRPASRTLTLAAALGQALADRAGAGPPEIVDLGAFGTRLLVPDDAELTAAVAAARAAGTLVVATPTYKGSYTGVLKVFLDYVPQNGLAGVAAVPVTVGGVIQQAEQSGRHLSGLLAELGAEVRPGVAVTEAQLGDPTIVSDYGLTHARDPHQ